MKNIFICVLHDKVSATKLIAHRAKAQMDKHLATLPSVDGDMPLDYAVIATIYHAATNIIKIISNINCTRLTEDTYDLQDFLEHFITATDRKALVIEANLGQTAGSAVTAVADHIIQRIQPSLLTLIAGKQCKASMESYEKPANCWSLQCATHDQMIRAVDQQMTELFMATALQGKSKTATTLMESTDRTALVSVQSKEPPGVTLSCMPPAANQDQPIKSKHLTLGKQKISAAETMPPAQQTIYQQACEQCATCCLITYCTQMFIWSTRRRVDIIPLAGKQLTEDLELESQRNAHRRLT